jgi:hypothetical protein
MNTQQEMMKILQATNAFYTSPITQGWQLAKSSDSVFGTHNVTGISYFFELNPETKVIKIESFQLAQPKKIIIYTGTISLGGRLIAPDMILALHTLFSFDFASDATFVVEKNRAKLMQTKKEKRKFSIASDDSLAGKKFQDPTEQTSSSLWDEAISTVPVRSKFSKFVRCLVYPSLNFKRKS